MKEQSQSQSISVKNNTSSITFWGDSYILGTGDINTLTTDYTYYPTTDYTYYPNTDHTTDSFSVPKDGITLTFDADSSFDFIGFPSTMISSS